MSASVPARRCGFLPCTADLDAAIEMLWDHIEKAHTAEFPYVDEAAIAEELVRECDDDCPHPSHEEQP